MPIRPRTLKEYGSPFVVVTLRDTLAGALTSLRQQHTALNSVYLVVQRDDGGPLVAPALAIPSWLAALGPAALDQTLETLPFSAPSRVEQADTPVSGMAIVHWLATRPGDVAVILSGGQVIGVLANPDRGAEGEIDRGILNALHGPLASLADDLRSQVQTRVPAPECPHCRAKNFFRYDTGLDAFRCPSCLKPVVRR